MNLPKRRVSSFLNTSNQHGSQDLINAENTLDVNRPVGSVSKLTRTLPSYILILGVLIKAAQPVLTEEEFKLPTPPTIAAKQGAEQILAWYATTDDQEIELFPYQLVMMLQSCFKDMKRPKDTMFEQLNIYSTAESWAIFFEV